jgi:hypothetical protein
MEYPMSFARRQTNAISRPSLTEQFALRDGTFSAVLDILEAVNHPYGLSIALKMKYGEFESVVKTDLDPLHFENSQDFADAYLSVKLLSKFPYLATGIDKQQVALESFLKAERACLETNRRFRRLREGRDNTLNPAVQAVISIAVRKISRILGRVDLDKVSEQFGWGPGASIGVRGQHTSAYNKFSGPLDVSRNCLTMGLCCVNSSPSWVSAAVRQNETPSMPASALPGVLNIVTGSEIIFVPKNAKTDRVIAIEPSLNSYIQQGIGRYIRKRLRERVGVDLSDQSINQSLAQYGSRTGELATIDLSMASDTISKELVRELLPEEWFDLLAACRCEQGTVKLTNETVWFQKFSSMGNAYTFELESMIFYALAKACVDQLKGEQPEQLNTVSVYGDDIILPCYAVPLLLEVLNFCGFSVNESKSYDSGPFRESCGKDFFRGTSVRPIFIKDRIDDVESAIRLANAVRRYAHMRNHLYGCDSRFARPWAGIVSRIPKSFRFKIPDGYGDGGLVSNFDEAVPARPKDGWEGYLTRAIRRVPYRTVYKEESFGYTTTLFLARGAPQTEEVRWFSSASQHYLTSIRLDGENTTAQGRYAPRDRTLPKIGSLLVRDWYNLGPWSL